VADSFEGQVTAWVAKTQRRMKAVRDESTQRVLAVAQTTVGEGGNLPFKTGFLRSSLKVGLGDPQFTVSKPPADGAAPSYDASAVTLTIANAKIEDSIKAVWTAAYAARMNYGFVGKDSLGREYNQRGYKFRDLAVQQWPQIVSAVCKEAQQRVEGS
jgi:hypothetical protein